ncbi:hypothetical protein [Pyxidicoccus trucidator]|uniref:hypothetical protein n=1 Tax=Pyxidicoccus trucidator TaxID=2709662 RepID=UPI00196848EA|nr:hypothetical protein [Pyxidicoccus trucidator]
MAVLVVVWGLMGTAVAAEPSDDTDDALEKLSTGLLQARMASEQKRLEAAESELTALRHELQKARARQTDVRARKFDAATVAPLLARFQKDFAAVTEVTSRGGLPVKDVYARLERSATELYNAQAFALDSYFPQTMTQGQRTPLSDELYGDAKVASLPSWNELQVLQFPQLGRDSGMTPDVFIEQMKESLSSATERAKTLSMGELERLFAQDQEAVAKVWQGVIDRTQATIDLHGKQVKDSQSAIDKLSVALDAREVQKFETDGRLTWAIIIMVVVLLLLYLATLLFKPEVQQTIFQQRILVEMIGMAFLLLTIIILGTGEKIDRAVLGTLLGTVGGYIFGQQQARRGADPQPAAQPVASGPPQPTAEQPATQPVASAPAQPVAQQPAPVSAQPPVVAPVQPAPVSAAPAQAAALLQQAVQQGDTLAASPGTTVPIATDDRVPTSATPPASK